jgi:hypothetical membrane protein
MPGNHRLTRLMLCAAVAVPLVYFGVQLIAAPYYPGYSFATDTASMLGTAASRHPGIFNNGAILDGIAGFFGAAGLFLGLSSVATRWLRALIAIGVFCNGVLSFKAGLFPMPDPRHASWQFLLFPILITPLLMLAAMWRTSVWLRVYLLVDVVLSASYASDDDAPHGTDLARRGNAEIVCFRGDGTDRCRCLRGPAKEAVLGASADPESHQRLRLNPPAARILRNCFTRPWHSGRRLRLLDRVLCGGKVMKTAHHCP